ncbi:MAG: spermidine/putrescine ABC transporter substrate-binding protein [Actinomycetota bacterium]
MLTRDELLRRAALGAGLLSMPGLLAACGGGNGGSGGKRELAKTMRFSNWTYYMDVDEKTKKWLTLEAFKKEFGVDVKYTEDVDSNSQFFGKIQGPLSRDQSIDRDLIVLTDNERFLATVIDKGWAEKLDKDAIPNIENLVDVQRHPGFDPDREYSLPWCSGMTGIAYNTKLTKQPVTSMEQLLEDKALKGKVAILNSFADTLGLVILENGDDPGKITDDSFSRALDRVQAAQDAGQFRGITGNSYTGPLASGDLLACVGWSGDIEQLHLDNPDLTWVIPKAGGMIWTDNVLIPKGGDAYTASVFMNYIYDPEVAAKLYGHIHYISPVKGSREALIKIDPETANNELFFPTEKTLSQVHLVDPAALKNQSYNEQWQAVLGV